MLCTHKLLFLFSILISSFLITTANAQILSPCDEEQLAALSDKYPKTFPYSAKNLEKVLNAVKLNWLSAWVCENGPGVFTTFEDGNVNIIYVVYDRRKGLFFAPMIEGNISSYIRIQLKDHELL